MNSRLPKFSIIIPTYNRAGLVNRAIASCLKQSYGDFELVVVDDASTDHTAQVLSAIRDPRVKVLRLAENRGVCSARNRGLELSRGEWIMFLDSDDELLPEVLHFIDDCTRRQPPDICRLAFMIELDRGGLAPQPPLPETTWDYQGYLKWCNTLRGNSNFANVCRRRTFEKVKFPEGRAQESLYHLDFARLYLTRTFPRPVVLEHSDAPLRSFALKAQAAAASPEIFARQVDDIMAGHADSLRAFHPAYYDTLCREGIWYHFSAGQRGRGWHYTRRLIQRRPFFFKAWVLAFLGTLLGQGTRHLYRWRIQHFTKVKSGGTR